MAKKLADFLGYHVGDLISLSDLQTQLEFKKEIVDFPIRDIRQYVEPSGVFTYIGYMVEAPTGQEFMIVVKSMGEDYEVYVFYMDQSGTLYEAEDGQDSCPHWCLLSDDLKDLRKRFEAYVEGPKGNRSVTWDRQTVTHGIEFRDTNTTEGICSLGEYFTNDENDGNNFCLLDWKGDAAKGLLEIWYGCRIENSEIELFHK
jgi:hypothetical protein